MCGWGGEKRAREGASKRERQTDTDGQRETDRDRYCSPCLLTRLVTQPNDIAVATGLLVIKTFIVK